VDELRQAARAGGVGDLDSVAAMVLATDGSMSVIKTADIDDVPLVPDED
jgi:uncharacterized membrane protein YcaP (DUF421 family)